MAGKEISLPTYNFVSGKREYNGEKLALTEDMILVIEGLHALNPLVTEKIAPKFCNPKDQWLYRRDDL